MSKKKKKKKKRFKIPMNSLSYYPKIDCSEKAAAKWATVIGVRVRVRMVCVETRK